MFRLFELKTVFTESDYCSKITSVPLVCDYELSIILMNRKLDSQKLRSGLSEYFLLAADYLPKRLYLS